MRRRAKRDKEEITLCVPGGSLYLLLLISLVVVCGACERTLPILQHKVSKVPKPHSRPMSLALTLTLFFSPRLSSLSSYMCQEAGKATQAEGKTESWCFCIL